MPLKTQIYNHCMQLLENKQQELKQALAEIIEEAKADTKSTAGDKHETSRAMRQMEQEKIISQLEKVSEQINLLVKINLNNKDNKIAMGSLVCTDKGYFFLSLSLGKIQVEGKPIYVLSPASPLGSKLLGLRAGDSAMVNGVVYTIKEAI